MDSSRKTENQLPLIGISMQSTSGRFFPANKFTTAAM